MIVCRMVCGNETEVKGVMYDPEKNEVLGFVFPSVLVAQRFLETCERVGIELEASHTYKYVQQLYQLWYDAWKRDGGNGDADPRD